MVAILRRQTVQRSHSRRAARRASPVAHKTGEITRIQHDAAIVYAPRPFVLVVLIRGLDDTKKASTLAADITRVVYAASNPSH